MSIAPPLLLITHGSAGVFSEGPQSIFAGGVVVHFTLPSSSLKRRGTPQWKIR